MRFQQSHEATLDCRGYTLVQNAPDWEKNEHAAPVVGGDLFVASVWGLGVVMITVYQGFASIVAPLEKVTTYDACNATIWLTRVGGKWVSKQSLLHLRLLDVSETFSDYLDAWLKDVERKNHRSLHTSAGRIRMQRERKAGEEGFGLTGTVLVRTFNTHSPGDDCFELILRIKDIHDACWNWGKLHNVKIC